MADMRLNIFKDCSMESIRKYTAEICLAICLEIVVFPVPVSPLNTIISNIVSFIDKRIH